MYDFTASRVCAASSALPGWFSGPRPFEGCKVPEHESPGKPARAGGCRAPHRGALGLQGFTFECFSGVKRPSFIREDFVNLMFGKLQWRVHFLVRRCDDSNGYTSSEKLPPKWDFRNPLSWSPHGNVQCISAPFCSPPR